MGNVTTHIAVDDGAVYDLAGAVHRVILDGSHTGGAATLAEVTVAPGAGTPPHSDEREYLVWYVVEGVLDFETDNGRLELGSGESVTVERGSVHAFVNSGDAPVKALMIAVPAGIEDFLRDAATVLPPGVPAGPPPPEAMEAFAATAARHGVTLHDGPPPS